MRVQNVSSSGQDSTWANWSKTVIKRTVWWLLNQLDWLQILEPAAIYQLCDLGQVSLQVSACL